MASAVHDRILDAALTWHRGSGAAIATVLQTWGSAPRPAGSQLAIGVKGEINGSVSGGCVEGAVVAEAMDCLESGNPLVLDFGVSDEDAFAVGLACGGKIQVLVEPVGGVSGLPEHMLVELLDRIEAKRPTVMLTNVNTWERLLASERSGETPVAVGDRLASDKCGFEGDWFVNVFNPPLRMIVVGGVHIAQPLLEMAGLAGYDTVLIDPREAFASNLRFPDIPIIHDWPDEAVEAQKPDRRTAVVTLSHDPKIDDPAIQATLCTNAFYIGCLGSTRTHAKRVARLEQGGVCAEDIARIHAPIGMDIGARSPAEIAVSIMAEITLRLRNGTNLE